MLYIREMISVPARLFSSVDPLRNLLNSVTYSIKRASPPKAFSSFVPKSAKFSLFQSSEFTSSDNPSSSASCAEPYCGVSRFHIT